MWPSASSTVTLTIMIMIVPSEKMLLNTFIDNAGSISFVNPSEKNWKQIPLVWVQILFYSLYVKSNTTATIKLSNLKLIQKVFQHFILWIILVLASQYLPFAFLLIIVLQQNPQDNQQPNGEKGKTLPAALPTVVLGTTQIVPTARKSQLLQTWVYQVRYL